MAHSTTKRSLLALLMMLMLMLMLVVVLAVEGVLACACLKKKAEGMAWSHCA